MLETIYIREKALSLCSDAPDVFQYGHRVATGTAGKQDGVAGKQDGADQAQSPHTRHPTEPLSRGGPSLPLLSPRFPTKRDRQIQTKMRDPNQNDCLKKRNLVRFFPHTRQPVSASGTNTSTLYVLRPERPQTARAALVHTNVVVVQPSSSLHQNHISITVHESLLEHHPVSTTLPPLGGPNLREPGVGPPTQINRLGIPISNLRAPSHRCEVFVKQSARIRPVPIKKIRPFSARTRTCLRDQCLDRLPICVGSHFEIPEAEEGSTS